MLLKGIKREWRGRGFGIHSPFAFRFIRSVLREKTPYYAYSEIKKISRNRSEYRRLTLLFRLVCEFMPETIVIYGDEDEKMGAVISLASPERHILHRRPNETESFTFVCIAAESPEALATALTACENGGVILVHACSEKFSRAIAEKPTFGMSFTNGSSCIHVVRHDLPRQTFELRF